MAQIYKFQGTRRRLLWLLPKGQADIFTGWGGGKWNHTSIVKAMWTKRPINNALCGSSGLWGSSSRLSPGFFGVTIKSQAAETEATSHQNRTH